MPTASLACAIWALSVPALCLPAGAFDLQGHRGARGLAPENTLAAFRLGQNLGVTTLETDLAVTRDGVLVLSHDPFLNPDLVRLDGQWIAPPGAPIRSLSFAELERYDIGRIDPATKYARQFPQQKPADGQRFPTPDQLVAAADPAVRFNIEIKTDPEKPDLTLPPEPFAEMAVAAIRKAGMAGRSTLQSFDWRAVIAAHRLAPEIPTSCLSIESNGFDTVRRAGGQPSPWLGGLDLAAHGGSVPRLAKTAGCAVWSPFWRNVTADAVREAHAQGLKVIPWTVNSPADMAMLIDLGVDGLITDYPDRAAPVLAAKGVKAR